VFFRLGRASAESIRRPTVNAVSGCLVNVFEPPLWTWSPPSGSKVSTRETRNDHSIHYIVDSTPSCEWCCPECPPYRRHASQGSPCAEASGGPPPALPCDDVRFLVVWVTDPGSPARAPGAVLSDPVEHSDDGQRWSRFRGCRVGFVRCVHYISRPYIPTVLVPQMTNGNLGTR